jgi:hypothetical protein
MIASAGMVILFAPVSMPLLAGKNTKPNGTSGTALSYSDSSKSMEAIMGFGRGALLWLIGIPLPIILLLALFMHH